MAGRIRRDKWNTLRLTMGWTVLVLWAASTTLNTLPTIHNITPPDLTPVMMVVAGGLFAPDIIARLMNGRNHKPRDDNAGD